MKLLHIVCLLLIPAIAGCATTGQTKESPAEASPAVTEPEEPSRPETIPAPAPASPARPAKPPRDRQIKAKSLSPQETKLLEDNLVQARLDVREKPGDPLMHYKLGNCLFDLQRYKEAIEVYDRAIALAPTLPAPHTNRGLCLRRVGRVDEAIQEYQFALGIQPEDPVLLQNLAIALEGEGETLEAVKVLARLANVRPDDVRVLARLAHGLFLLGRYSEAGWYFQEIVRLDPGLASDYYNLGLCYFQLRDYDRALMTWLTALAHDGRNPSVNKGLAVLYWKRAEYEQAWNMVASCRSKGIALDEKFLASLLKDSQEPTLAGGT